MHFAHLAGAQEYQERQGYYSVLPIQARHLYLTQVALRSMEESDDPLAFAQATYYMGYAYLSVQSINTGLRYLRRSLQVICRNNIRFVQLSTGDTVDHKLDTLPSQTHLEPMELTLERATMLSNLLFLGIRFFLVGQPSVAVVGLQFSKDFSSQMPVRCYSALRYTFSDDYTQTFYSEIFSPQDKLADVFLELEEQFRYEFPVSAFFHRRLHTVIGVNNAGCISGIGFALHISCSECNVCERC